MIDRYLFLMTKKVRRNWYNRLFIALGIGIFSRLLSRVQQYHALANHCISEGKIIDRYLFLMTKKVRRNWYNRLLLLG